MRRLLPVSGVWTLLVLAPWIGEYLLGNIPLELLPALPFLLPMYGGGALLIREVTRRTGRGWPTVLLLGGAYGLIEAGLVDQSMFNADFEQTLFLARHTYVEALGLDVSNTLSFVFGHAVYSIATAVAFAEYLAPPALRREPWLGPVGLAVTVVLYLLGCLIIYSDQVDEYGFVASAGQRAWTVVGALALVVLAFVPLRVLGVRREQAGWLPSPIALGGGCFAALGVTFARPESWAGVALGGVLPVVVVGWLLVRWSTHPGWTVGHEHAVAVAALLTYAWGGFVLTGLVRPDDVLAWVGNALFAVLAAGLAVVSRRRVVSVPPN